MAAMGSASVRSHLESAKGRIFRLTTLLVWISSLTVLAAARAQVATPHADEFGLPTVIVVGFVGGFVRSDDDRHLEVRMIERLSKDNPRVVAKVFENRHTAAARNEILQWLDTDGDGRLSDREKRNARIVLVGHSWGGSAAIRLAKELNQDGIPIQLTIQLDSVNRGSGDDCLIPPNVAQALNFYQTRGLVHGCRMLRAADASRTQMLGSFRMNYATVPSDCSYYPWLDRLLLKAHNAVDCDPDVWSRVEEQIRHVIRVQEARGSAGLALP
jgi:pimeloyl-ACP methyl ester carboxylesterase